MKRYMNLTLLYAVLAMVGGVGLQECAKSLRLMEVDGTGHTAGYDEPLSAHEIGLGKGEVGFDCNAMSAGDVTAVGY